MFRIIFLALILGVATGVGAVYYDREVGDLPDLGGVFDAETATPAPTAAVAPTPEPDEMIVFAYGPAPPGDYTVDMTGNVQVGAQRVDFQIDMDGSMRGARSGEFIDLIIDVDDFSADFMGQSIRQPIDATVIYRYDDAGRFISADLSGFGAAGTPLPVGQAEEFRYLTAPFPPEGVRVGDRLPFSDTQTMEGYPGSPEVTVTGEVIFVDHGSLAGRETVTIDMLGRILSSTVNGTFSGTSVIDVDSGFVLDADLTLSMNAPIQNRRAVVNVDMDFETRL